MFHKLHITVCGKPACKHLRYRDQSDNIKSKSSSKLCFQILTYIHQNHQKLNLNYMVFLARNLFVLVQLFLDLRLVAVGDEHLAKPCLWKDGSAEQGKGVVKEGVEGGEETRTYFPPDGKRQFRLYFHRLIRQTFSRVPFILENQLYRLDHEIYARKGFRN